MVNEKYLNKLCNNKQDTYRDNFKWSMREFVARKMSSTIWGQGYMFQSEDENIEKKFKKFEKMNRLPMLSGFIERYLSMYGRCIITINKTKTDDIMINIPNPFYFNGVGKVFVQPQLAVVWQRYEIDTNLYIVKTTYDTKKVVNELYTKNQAEETVRVFDKEASILEMLQIEKEWVHNLGFVPVVEMTNISFYQFIWNNLEFATITDWYPGVTFEDMIYSAIKNLVKELHYCHSRVLVDNANQQIIDSLKTKALLNDEIDISDWAIETENGAQMKVIPGNGDFTKYTQTIDHLMDFYFKFCGGSRFSEGGGAQKTVAETSSVRSAMIESVNSKILLRNDQFTDLIKKVLAAMGLLDYWEDEDKFSFRINGNILKDDTSFIDNIIKKIEMGAMSVIDAIQEIFNLSRREATKKFEEIKEFNEENDIMVNFFNNGLEEGESESGFNKETGQHKDPAKEGKA